MRAPNTVQQALPGAQAAFIERADPRDCALVARRTQVQQQAQEIQAKPGGDVPGEGGGKIIA